MMNRLFMDTKEHCNDCYTHQHKRGLHLPAVLNITLAIVGFVVVPLCTMPFS